MIKKVCVIMSTYNGAAYIEKQIESIMQQKNIEIILYIRDDGSTDNTIDIIRKCKKIYSKKIILKIGNNIGYKRSFMEALVNCPLADYFAFADQDDIWDEDKIVNAVNVLKKLDNIALYASSLKLIDENGCEIGENNIGNMQNNIECYFARPRLAGCTYLFTPKLRDISLEISRMPYITYPDHDFIIASCAYAFGNVYLDENSGILHRRLAKSVTGGSNGFIKRIRVEKNVIFEKNKVCKDMANNLLKMNEVKEDVKDFLECMKEYDKSLLNKIKLLKRKKFRSGIIICDMEMLFKVMIEKM